MKNKLSSHWEKVSKAWRHFPEKMTKRFCVVPARGGSKRFPRKNISLLAGKPLIFHTLDVVISCFDKVVFSSDNDEILSFVESQNYSSKVLQIDKRPAKLATDTSKVIDTVSHYFDEMESDYDEVWLALPTCPLRTKTHVKEAQKLLENNKEANGVISITNYEFPPQLALKREKNETIKDWNNEKPWLNGNSRSQDHETLYRPNGAIYGMKTKHFKLVRNFYKGNILGYFMKRECSADIDTELDFQWAEMLYKQKGK